MMDDIAIEKIVDLKLRVLTCEVTDWPDTHTHCDHTVFMTSRAAVEQEQQTSWSEILLFGSFWLTIGAIVSITVFVVMNWLYSL